MPCPSRADTARNRHRTGLAWTTPTVAAILANPRYTGRQVWNRQPTVAPPDDGRPLTGLPRPVAGERDRPQRWNPVAEWIISDRRVHPALVSEADFVAVQAIRTDHPGRDSRRRTYLLAGLLQCGICGRRMDCHWVNDRPGYRCRHGRTTAHAPDATRPRTLYLREDQLLTDLTALFASDHTQGDHARRAALLREQQISNTCDHHDRRLSQPLTPALKG